MEQRIEFAIAETLGAIENNTEQKIKEKMLMNFYKLVPSKMIAYLEGEGKIEVSAFYMFVCTLTVKTLS